MANILLCKGHIINTHTHTLPVLITVYGIVHRVHGRKIKLLIYLSSRCTVYELYRIPYTVVKTDSVCGGGDLYA